MLDFPQAKAAKAFAYDHEWLATLHATHHLFTLDRRQRPLPGEAISTSHLVTVHALCAGSGAVAACQNSLNSVFGKQPLPEMGSLHVPACMVLGSSLFSRVGLHPLSLPCTFSLMSGCLATANLRS